MRRLQGLKTNILSSTGYIALGSNLAPATTTSLQLVNKALGLFTGANLRITKQSQWYSAPAFPAGNGQDYVNGVVEITSNLPANAILAALHQIETTLGRTRPARWAARVVDLDLLALGPLVAPDLPGFKHWCNLPPSQQMRTTPDALVLPHPRLQDRAFVLKPLAEIAPDWRHPVLGKTAAALLAALPESAQDEVLPIVPAR